MFYTSEYMQDDIFELRERFEDIADHRSYTQNLRCYVSAFQNWLKSKFESSHWYEFVSVSQVFKRLNLLVVWFFFNLLGNFNFFIGSDWNVTDHTISRPSFLFTSTKLVAWFGPQQSGLNRLKGDWNYLVHRYACTFLGVSWGSRRKHRKLAKQIWLI